MCSSKPAHHVILITDRSSACSVMMANSPDGRNEENQSDPSITHVKEELVNMQNTEGGFRQFMMNPGMMRYPPPHFFRERLRPPFHQQDFTWVQNPYFVPHAPRLHQFHEAGWYGNGILFPNLPPPFQNAQDEPHRIFRNLQHFQGPLGTYPTHGGVQGTFAAHPGNAPDPGNIPECNTEVGDVQGTGSALPGDASDPRNVSESNASAGNVRRTSTVLLEGVTNTRNISESDSPVGDVQGTNSALPGDATDCGIDPAHLVEPPLCSESRDEQLIRRAFAIWDEQQKKKEAERNKEKNNYRQTGFHNKRGGSWNFKRGNGGFNFGRGGGGNYNRTEAGGNYGRRGRGNYRGGSVHYYGRGGRFNYGRGGGGNYYIRKEGNYGRGGGRNHRGGNWRREENEMQGKNSSIVIIR